MKEIESKKAGLIPELLRKAGELGLLMVEVPVEYGGLGLGETASMLLAEQFARVASFSVSLGAHTRWRCPPNTRCNANSSESR